MKLESLNNSKFEKLSEKELEQIKAGWKLFGFDAIYADQTMASIGNLAATGDYGSTYVFGFVTKTGFRQDDTVND